MYILAIQYRSIEVGFFTRLSNTCHKNVDKTVHQTQEWYNDKNISHKLDQKIMQCKTFPKNVDKIVYLMNVDNIGVESCVPTYMPQFEVIHNFDTFNKIL